MNRDELARLIRLFKRRNPGACGKLKMSANFRKGLFY